MTEIEDLEDIMMSVKDAVDNNKETTKSPTNNLTFYDFVLTDKVSTPPNYPIKSDKLLVSFKFLSKIPTLTCLLRLGLQIFQNSLNCFQASMCYCYMGNLSIWSGI